MRHWNINIEVAGGEADPSRLAVGDDVDRVKTVAAVERGGDLLRHRAGGVEEDRLDLGAQVVEDRLDVRDAGVDEDHLTSGDFTGSGHGKVLNFLARRERFAEFGFPPRSAEVSGAAGMRVIRN